MDTDYKGWGGSDSRRAFEANRAFSVEGLRLKATHKWRGGLFRDRRDDVDRRVPRDGEASRTPPTRATQAGKTKARLDFGFGLELASGGDPSTSFRPECRLKARFSSNDAAPRLTVRLVPRPELVVGAVVPLEASLHALCALGRGRERRAAPAARAETKTLREGTALPRDEKRNEARGVCVRVEASAPLPLAFLGDERGSRRDSGAKSVSVTARLVRPEARGAFVSTNGLEFDFPDVPLSFGAGRTANGEPGDTLALRLRGSVDIPRAGFGASAAGLERVDDEDAPVRVAVRKLGVKRVVRWWRRPDARDGGRRT